MPEDSIQHIQDQVQVVADTVATDGPIQENIGIVNEKLDLLAREISEIRNHVNNVIASIDEVKRLKGKG